MVSNNRQHTVGVKDLAQTQHLDKTLPSRGSGPGYLDLLKMHSRHGHLGDSLPPAHIAPLTFQRPVLSRRSRRRGDSASPGRLPAALLSGAPAVPAGAREGLGDENGQRGPGAAGDFSVSPQSTARSPQPTAYSSAAGQPSALQ